MRLVMRAWVAAMPAALASHAAQPTPAHAADPYAGWTQRTAFKLPLGVRHATVFPVTAAVLPVTVAELNRIRTAWTPNRLVSESNGRCLDVRNADQENQSWTRS